MRNGQIYLWLQRIAFSYTPFTSQYTECSYTFTFCSKKIVWSRKRPQKGVLQGLQLVRKVSSGLWLSSFSSCIFSHSSWFFHAVQVFGLWCLNRSVMLVFSESISPLENDSPGTVFASFSTILADKTAGSALLFGHGQRATCWDGISLPG